VDPSGVYENNVICSFLVNKRKSVLRQDDPDTKGYQRKKKKKKTLSASASKIQGYYMEI
jgi:hypothetical protein